MAMQGAEHLNAATTRLRAANAAVGSLEEDDTSGTRFELHSPLHLPEDVIEPHVELAVEADNLNPLRSSSPTQRKSARRKDVSLVEDRHTFTSFLSAIASGLRDSVPPVLRSPSPLELEHWYISLASLQNERLAREHETAGGDEAARLVRDMGENNALAKQRIFFERQTAMTLAAALNNDNMMPTAGGQFTTATRAFSAAAPAIPVAPLSVSTARRVLGPLCPSAAPEPDAAAARGDVRFLAALASPAPGATPHDIQRLVYSYLLCSLRLWPGRAWRPAATSPSDASRGAHECSSLSNTDIESGSVPSLFDVVRKASGVAGNHSSGAKLSVLREVIAARYAQAATLMLRRPPSGQLAPVPPPTMEAPADAATPSIARAVSTSAQEAAAPQPHSLHAAFNSTANATLHGEHAPTHSAAVAAHHHVATSRRGSSALATSVSVTTAGSGNAGVSVAPQPPHRDRDRDRPPNRRVSNASSTAMSLAHTTSSGVSGGGAIHHHHSASGAEPRKATQSIRTVRYGRTTSLSATTPAMGAGLGASSATPALPHSAVSVSARLPNDAAHSSEVESSSAVQPDASQQSHQRPVADAASSTTSTGTLGNESGVSVGSAAITTRETAEQERHTIEVSAEVPAMSAASSRAPSVSAHRVPASDEQMTQRNPTQPPLPSPHDVARAFVADVNLAALLFTRGLLSKYPQLTAVVPPPPPSQLSTSGAARGASMGAAGSGASPRPSAPTSGRVVELTWSLGVSGAHPDVTASSGVAGLDASKLVLRICTEALHAMLHESTAQRLFRAAHADADARWCAAAKVVCHLPPCAFGASHAYCLRASASTPELLGGTLVRSSSEGSTTSNEWVAPHSSCKGSLLAMRCDAAAADAAAKAYASAIACARVLFEAQRTPMGQLSALRACIRSVAFIAGVEAAAVRDRCATLETLAAAAAAASSAAAAEERSDAREDATLPTPLSMSRHTGRGVSAVDVSRTAAAAAVSTALPQSPSSTASPIPRHRLHGQHAASSAHTLTSPPITAKAAPSSAALSPAVRPTAPPAVAVGADDLLPRLCFVLARASQHAPHALSTCAFLEVAMPEDRAMGEDGYAVVSLRGALTHVQCVAEGDA